MIYSIYASSALLQLFRYTVECMPGQILSYSVIDHTLQGRVNGQCVDFLGEYIICLCGTERISSSNQIVYTFKASVNSDSYFLGCYIYNKY